MEQDERPRKDLSGVLRSIEMKKALQFYMPGELEERKI